MTDFWKSGARHWCTYCKIFINGTKPSIAYHENGKKHKEIKEMTLKAMRQRARERGKDKQELESELAKIESAALRQYQRHDAPGSSSSSSSSRPALPPDGDRASRLAALEQQIEASKLLRSGVGPAGLPLGWRMQTNPDGVVYYEHMATGTMQWEPPQSAVSAEVEPEAASPALPEGWQRDRSADGTPYYYNAELGLTQWSVPEAPQESAQAGGDAGDAGEEEAGDESEGGEVKGEGGDDDASALPAGWQRGESEDGKSYYFNAELGLTQWSVPEAPQEEGEDGEEGEVGDDAGEGQGEGGVSVGALGDDGTAEDTGGAEELQPQVDENTGLGMWTVVERSPSPEPEPEAEPSAAELGAQMRRQAAAGRAEGRKKKKMRFTRLDEDGDEQPQEMLDHLQEHYPMPEDMRAAMARVAEAQASEEPAGPVTFNKRRSDKAGFRRKRPGGL